MITPVQILRITKGIARGGKLLPTLNGEGISPLEFFKHLDNVPEDRALFAKAREVAMEVNLDEAIDLIDSAETKFELEKAKAQLGVRTWFAEKLRPELYGTKIEHNVNQTINIVEILREANARVPGREQALVAEYKVVEPTHEPRKLTVEEEELL